MLILVRILKPWYKHNRTRNHHPLGLPALLQKMADETENVFLTVLWVAVWLLLLILTLYPAAIAACVYIVVYIFVPCLPALKEVTDLVHNAVLLPYYCSDNIVNLRDLKQGWRAMCCGRSDKNGAGSLQAASSAA